MLAQNKILDDENVVRKRKRITTRQNNLKVVTSPPPLREKNKSRESDRVVAEKINSIPLPWWLQGYSAFSHTSSWLTVVIVLITGSVYAVTVYAPQQWTSKYNELQDLRQRERQFTLADEIFKNKLAQEAIHPQSGLVNPENSQPPIFLPHTEVKPLELPVTETVKPKTVKPVFPIAY